MGPFDVADALTRTQPIHTTDPDRTPAAAALVPQRVRPHTCEGPLSTVKFTFLALLMIAVLPGLIAFWYWAWLHPGTALPGLLLLLGSVGLLTTSAIEEPDPCALTGPAAHRNAR